MALTFEANNKKLNLNSKMWAASFAKFRSVCVFQWPLTLLALHRFLRNALPKNAKPLWPWKPLNKIYEEPLLSVSVQLQRCGAGTPPLIKAAAWMDMWVSSAPSIHPSVLSPSQVGTWGLCPEFFITAHAGRITSPRENDVSYSAARLRVRDICQVVSWVMTSTCSLSPASNQNIWIWL